MSTAEEQLAERLAAEATLRGLDVRAYAHAQCSVLTPAARERIAELAAAAAARA